MLNSILTDQPAKPEEYLPFFKETTPTATINDCSFDLVVALAAKGFVILTGQSGTGKSRSALQLGQGLDALEEYDNNTIGSSYELVPVGADWTDARPLIGYTNPFGIPRKTSKGEVTHTTYEVPDPLRLLLRAAAPSGTGVPFLLVLDEMNLSHMERYFSPFLSLIEANRSSAADSSVPLLPVDKITLISEVLTNAEPNSVETAAVQELVAGARGLPVPGNLLIVGTVNVDETTYMFSPKVLDRAHVLEMHSVRPKDYFNKATDTSLTMSIRQAFDLLAWAIESRGSGIFDQHPAQMFEVAKGIAEDASETIEAIHTATITLLDGAYLLLDPVGFGFGFRAVNELCAYMLCWIKARILVGQKLEGWQQALDNAFLQKILPKIHGNRRQLGDSILAIEAFLRGNDETSTPAAKYRIGGADAVGISAAAALNLNVLEPMAASRIKLRSMHTQLQATGYATFIR